MDNWQVEYWPSLPQGLILDILLASAKSVVYSPSDIRAAVISEYLDPPPRLLPAVQLHRTAPVHPRAGAFGSRTS